MDKYINQFPEQLAEALRLAEGISVLHPATPVHNVIISGMGGSGIAGILLSEILADSLQVPMQVVNDYHLPAYANAHTLVICSSYSGETEETLSALQDAMQKKCSIVCVCTGGRMQKIAEEAGIPVVNMPGGMPPRSCLGYSLVLQLAVLHAMQLAPDTKEQIITAAALLSGAQKKIQEIALDASAVVVGATPVIYTGQQNNGIGIRWKQQINENAKMHCFQHSIPEMNHNELVAYQFEDERFGVLFLHTGMETERITHRMALSKRLMEPHAAYFLDFTAEGDSYIERMFYLIHLGDWLSYYLSELKEVNAVDIAILEHFKEQMRHGR
ncbi:MAG: bifunctional phosphoglucose/phosphomannose isomerase [Chitinophagales bacterium]